MIVWVDASSGASGDMLLAALHDAGVPAAVMADAAAAVAPVEITFSTEIRHGILVGRAHVRGVEDDVPHRTWADVRALLDAATLDPRVRERAHAAFGRLAEAEGAVHGTPANDVHFHEVGAHDAIGDIVGVCAGFTWLDASDVVVGPIALGGGTARAAHGEIPVPVPAVLELLAGSGAPAHGGPIDVELCTPTGAALLLTWATSFGPMPSLTTESVGSGAGSRVHPGRVGALRVVRGSAAPTASTSTAVVVETNVDDLDPRIWPHVLSALFDAGASDAWLTPILMKKGRPAHTLHVLCPGDEAVRRRIETIVLTHTSAIGLRTTSVDKVALARRAESVDVGGCAVRVKLALLDGRVVNAQPEHDDVVRAAAALGVPVKVALARAVAAAGDLLP